MAAENQAVRIRLALVDDAPGIASVHVRSWQSAYRGIVADSFLDALEPSSAEERWREALGQQAAERRFTYVAELIPAGPLPAGIVGFASAGPERDGLVSGGVAFDGEIYGLYLAPEHRRQGIGGRLVAAAAQLLVERGTKSVVIWALKDNLPARAFYAKLGGILAGEKNVTIGPTSLVDVAYGWPDAYELLRSARELSRLQRT